MLSSARLLRWMYRACALRARRLHAAVALGASFIQQRPRRNELQIAKRLLVDVGLSTDVPIYLYSFVHIRKVLNAVRGCPPCRVYEPHVGSFPHKRHVHPAGIENHSNMTLAIRILFLIRVGLALIVCLKCPLLAPMPLASSIFATSPNSSIALLHTDIILTLPHPPVSALPPTSNAFLASAVSAMISLPYELIYGFLSLFPYFLIMSPFKLRYLIYK